jgi:CheY-like chemotaxis protein
MTENALDQREAAPQRALRVLVVDDHEVGRNSLSRLLGLLGYETTTAKNGLSAVEALESGTPFDYVLTDLRLPDLDGREVVQAVHRLRPEARIALITGWDVEPDESIRLGIDWVFLKPLDVQDIVAKLRQSPPREQ